MNPNDPSAFTLEQSRLFDTIESRLALKLDDQRRADVARLAGDLVTSGNVKHLYDLVDYLSKQRTSQPLWQRFIPVVTVGETYFFRDQSQWNALRHSVLPRLIHERRAQGRRQLRLWSAGCSTGEEPYSMAILLRELISDFAAWDIHILATDLNVNNLERAREGQYRPWSFRMETPETVRQRWFIEEDGVYRIDPSIRAMVTFSSLNLASFARSTAASSLIEMDTIFCRNVLIYFDQATTIEVIRRFHHALCDDGWLVLGASEGIVPMGQHFKTHLFDNAALFQKIPRLDGEGMRSLPLKDTLPASVSIPHSASTPPITSDHKSAMADHEPMTTGNLDRIEQALQAANREEWAEALRWLADAEKNDRLSPKVYYLRGVIELNQAEYEKALASLRRAIYCDANFVMARYTLGDVYHRQGDYKKASTEWKLTQTIVRDLEPQSRLPFCEDLTAEMFLEVLKFRLDNLSPKH
jgi:chemotaxis protein methyltransferase CheR